MTGSGRRMAACRVMLCRVVSHRVARRVKRRRASPTDMAHGSGYTKELNHFYY